MLFLLFVFLFRKPLERLKGLIPELGEMIAQQCDALGIQLINPPCSCATVADQACLFQNAEVLRDGRARDGQSCRQLIHGSRMVTQHFEDGQPGGVAKSREAILYVSAHLR